MSDPISGADLQAYLAEQQGLQTKTAAETLQELTAEELASLSEEEQAALIAAVEEELAQMGGGQAKTASEIINELTPEELAAELAQLTPEQQQELMAQVEAEEAEQTKVAALMSGQFDDQALAGQVWGTAAGEAFASTLSKTAGDDEWEEVDVSGLTVAEFEQAIANGEIVQVDEDGQVKQAGDDEWEEVDVSGLTVAQLEQAIENGDIVLDDGSDPEKTAAGKLRSVMSYAVGKRGPRGYTNLKEGLKHFRSGGNRGGRRVAAKGAWQMATSRMPATVAAAGLITVPSVKYLRRRRQQ